MEDEKKLARDRFLAPSDVAQRLGVRIGTLSRWRASGIGPRFYKIESGTIRYSERELDEYMARRSCGGSAA